MKKIKVKIGGTEREYVAFIANITRTTVKRAGKEYPLYRLTVPRAVAEALAEMAGLPENVPVPVIVLVTPAEPYHLIDTELYDVPEARKAKEELMALGIET